MKFFKLFLASLLIHGSPIGCSVAVAGPGDTRIRADYVDGQDSSRNYIKDGDAETGTAVKGWTCYADAAGTSPVDGTGGTPNVTFTKTTSSPLENNNSFVFTKDAANRQGQGCSYDFTIDARLKSKMLQITFDNLVGSGTFAAGSDTTNSDVMVYVYDITNSKLVPLQGQTKFYSNSTTLAESFRAWFQAAPDSVNYRLILHVASTSTSAFTLKSDVFKVSESKQVVGTIITDWQSYTPDISTNTGAMTNFTITGFWRQVGGNGEYQIKILFSGASGTWTLPYVSLPSGQNIDATRESTAGLLGNVNITDAGIAEYSGVVTKRSQSTVWIYQSSVSSHTGTVPVVSSQPSNASPFAFNIGDAIVAKFSAPIAGWSAGARMSDGYDGRIIEGNYLFNGTQSIPNNTDTKISNFTTITSDPIAMWNNSLQRLEIKSTGEYKFDPWVNFGPNASATASGTASVIAYINGSSGGTIGYSQPLQSVFQNAGAVALSVGRKFSLKAGDYVEFYAKQTSGASLNLLLFMLNVEKLSGTPFMSPTALWETHYAGTAGDTIGTTDSLIKFTTKVEDTFGSYNPATGLWTAKGPAICSASWAVTQAPITLTTAQRFYSALRKDGVVTFSGQRVVGSGVSNAWHSPGSANSVSVVQGTTLSVIANSSVAGTSETGAALNYFTVSCRQSGN